MSALDRAIAIANEYHNGHFTLFRFTTNWRFCFGTPMFDHFTSVGFVDETFDGKTMDEAIEKAIKQEPLLVSGKVVAASDALLASAENEPEIVHTVLHGREIVGIPFHVVFDCKHPKLGDIVTWRDRDTGGCLSGSVTTVYIASVMVATDRGNGQFGYNRVFNGDICSIQRREGT